MNSAFCHPYSHLESIPLSLHGELSCSGVLHFLFIEACVTYIQYIHASTLLVCLTTSNGSVLGPERSRFDLSRLINKEIKVGVSLQTQGHWEEESNTPGTSEIVISLLSSVMQGIVFSTLLLQLARLEVLLCNSPSFLMFMLKVKPGHFFSVCL